jgi:bifunctional UDP-N-acetylglucosamine pyrophosphorylase / glucosamine-1-phosphate N-acetyltransferase
MKSELPKVLHRACGRSLLGHVLEATSGAQGHVVVLGHGRERVLAEFPERPFREAWQKEQKGTGHAAQTALPLLGDGLVLILNGDGPLLRAESLLAMQEAHLARKADLTLGVMELDDPFGYGRVITGPGGALKRIVEEKEAKAKEKKIRLVNGGIYLVSRKYLAEFLPKLKPAAASGELYLTDIVALGAAKKKKIQAFPFPAEELLGVNDLEQLAQVEKVLRRRLCSSWMRQGVRLDSPETLWADSTVVIEPGARIGPQVVLEGKTSIGAGARVEAGCVLIDTVVAAGAEIRAYSHLEGASVGEGAQVGPFARLRPGAELGKRSKVGNFVEVKKSRLGEGAKVNHLSYLGDAEVGAGVNVGCGFIACNFDGVNKHQTKIESGAFIGSGVQAVAPVTIGQDSYVATGSTINRDVPPGALAIARPRQENKEGYAERLRSRMKARKKEG